MSRNDQREQEIFLAALEMPVEARSRYLDDTCGDDRALRQRLDQLFDLHQDTTGILNTDSDLNDLTPGSDLTESPGTSIGPYKILQRIGEGGMGVVYSECQKSFPNRANRSCFIW